MPQRMALSRYGAVPVESTVSRLSRVARGDEASFHRERAVTLQGVRTNGPHPPKIGAAPTEWVCSNGGTDFR
ncbi:hypothetical protein SM139_0808 [Stenotrophomonas maltophilia]|nr:hypothetical protein SM139_0808 [Stenotrophomonas maltophilia]